MKQLAGFARFIHSTHLLVSAACVALCFQTAVLLDWLFIPQWFYLFMFSNTILVYALQQLTGKQVPANNRTNPSPALAKRTYVVAFTIISAIISGYLCLRLHKIQFVWLLISLVLIAGANFRVHPVKIIKNLKPNSALKLPIQALAIMIATTVIPATFIPFAFDSRFWWLLAVRFFYVLAICIPFTVYNDMIGEKKSGINLVSMFGLAGCYKLSYAALGISAVGVVPGLLIGVNILFLIPLLVSLVITGWTISYCSRHMFSPYSYIMLDGCMILQTLLICIPLLIP